MASHADGVAASLDRRREPPSIARRLAVLKVLYRNSARMQDIGGMEAQAAGRLAM
ncbi:MAG: hypothetical protein R3B96_02560 [Pirellulaceae bacterium]